MAKKRDKSPEQIARERIAKAKRAGKTFLDLSVLDLTALPPMIDLDPTAALLVQLDEGGVRAFDAASCHDC